jgi:hypothetical protein
MTFCVFLEISFMGRCKKSFYWLLIMEKGRERVNFMKVSKSKPWNWWKWVTFAYNLGQ